jgi:hypothetical protein
MQRLLAAILLAAACVVAATPGFARGGVGGFAHAAGHGFGRGSVPLFVEPPPQMPALENRIPAPLPSPSQAPIINGPLSQPSSGM